MMKIPILSRRPPPTLDRRWFSDQIKSRGFKTQAEFAEAIGLSAPKLTNALAGKRRLQVGEIEAIAEELKQPLRRILEKLGQSPRDDGWRTVELEGFVTEQGATFIIGKNLEAQDLGSSFAPFEPFEMTFIKIRTNLSSRYRTGDIIGVGVPDGPDVRHQTQSLADIIGEDVVCQLDDGRCRLCALHEGSTPGKWTLIALGDGAPILNASVRWASPIDVIIPRWTAEYPARERG